MKKRIFAVVIVLTLLSVLSIPASANSSVSDISQSEDITVIHHNNGTYTTIYPPQLIDAPQTASTGDTHNTSTYVQAVNRDEDDGTTNWIYTLYGEFTYVEGVSSTCTRAYYTHAVYNDDWEFSNGNAYASGNGAFGVGTFKRYTWFIPMETVNINFKIYCDSYGNFSS